MVNIKDFASPVKSTWCAGCGDFGILSSMKKALVALNLGPHQVMVVTGIGCGSKHPDYMTINGFTSLHGRPIPLAQGIHLANHGMKTIVIAGDGDTYGIGGNHFMHLLRRNSNITLLVQNNAVYGLTKGQYSPTSQPGFITKTSPGPEGALEQPVNPMTLALAAGGTFVGRSFSGDPRHLVEMITAAILHPGAALLDIFQPCVTYNKEFSYEFFRPRVYKLGDEGYDHTNLTMAYEKAYEWGDRIPIGILYQNSEQPSYEEQISVLKNKPLIKQEFRNWTEEDYRILEKKFV